MHVKMKILPGEATATTMLNLIVMDQAWVLGLLDKDFNCLLHGISNDDDEGRESSY